jgi:hypothetical protein
MKSAIRIVKRKQAEDIVIADSPTAEKPTESSAREITRTVKGWITEFKQRKNTQSHSFPGRVAIATEPASRDF